MKRLRTRAAPLVVTLLAALGAPRESATQRSFVNFEIHAVQGLALATIEFDSGAVQGDRQLLLVCNTPDNALEIYDALDYELLDRIPTGLAPVTVRWHEGRQCAYTCNHLGDSVTCVSISSTGVNQAGDAVIRASLEYTTAVGDEPCDITFLPLSNPEIAAITLRSRNAVTTRLADDMSEIDPRALLQPSLPGAVFTALKSPGYMQWASDRRLYILDRMDADDTDMNGLFDIDMYAIDGTFVSNPAQDDLFTPTSPYLNKHFGGMGTTHHAMAIDQFGSRMFVVGTRARHDVETEVNLAAVETGFVESWLWSVDLIGIGAPTLRPESPNPPAPAAARPSFNLNRDYAQSQTDVVGVPKPDALAQPTGIALLEDSATGALQKVIVTAFSSDRIGILTPDDTAPGGWTVQRVAINVFNDDAGGERNYSRSGPRSIVVSNEMSNSSGEPGIAFVLNALDNSVSVIDVGGTSPSELERFQLANDPTFNSIRIGRDFLYSGEHSGNGTVSCSSCHVDGHTDGIAWDLSEPQDGGPIPPTFKDGLPPGADTTNFTGKKLRMVTQTLRGLVNFTVTGEAQDLFTNAPYHWRGDRARFQNFNGAFEGLLDATQLPADDMDRFTKFVNTVRHPPNPEQDPTRRHRGVRGDAMNLFDPLAEGELNGMKIFFSGSDGTGHSCSMCHTLPEGSNNRGVDAVANGSPGPLESAALRHMFDREAVIRLGNIVPPQNESDQIWTRRIGITHSGAAIGDKQRESVNDLTAKFGPNLLHFQNVQGFDQVDLDAAADVIAFVRALDSGVAPRVGHAYTFVPGADNLTVTRAMIEQVEEANCDLVAHVEDAAGVRSGWWYDLTMGADGRFVNEETGADAGFGLLNGMVNNQGATVVVQSVPVGSGRTIASLDGNVATFSGSTPTNLTLEPMAMPTQYEEAGDLERNWILDQQRNPMFDQNGVPRFTFRPSIDAKMTLQTAIAPDFGMAVLKHEPPRRFRVTGTDILPGALLTIEVKDGTGGSVDLRLPLFPTIHTNAAGDRIWESFVETEDEMQFALLCGGPYLSPVQLVLGLRSTDPTILDPATNNSYSFSVQNEGGNPAGTGIGPLRIDHVR